MNSISTHVLDTSRGRPAEGIAITLEQFKNGQFEVLGKGATDADGRLKTLLAGHLLQAAIYRIRFETNPYFENLNIQSFYPYVEIVFTIRDPTVHYHVPLLLNPFGYSTYRGS